MSNISNDKLFLGMIFYSLFVSENGRFVSSLANELDISTDEIENLTKQGCYAFLGYSQTKFDFDHYMMSQHEFDHLRNKNPALHDLLKEERKKAQSKWSNERKSKFLPQMAAALCLPKPSQWDLTLARIEASVSCARFLNQAGQVDNSKHVIKIFASELTAE
jgi:hypothetical protein